MEKVIETEGGLYEISTQWDPEREAIRVNLKIQSRDWKKCNNIQAHLAENNYPFTLESFVMLGQEETWPGPDGSETDYSSVDILLTVTGLGKKELYKDKVNSSGKFYHDITFYIKPESQK